MPIYEYRCPNGHVFELFQKIGDAPPEKCEVCGEGPLERVLYPVAVHFKGSGFYTTDYAKKAKEGSGTDGGSSDSGGSDSGSSDSGSAGESKSSSKGSDKAASSSSSD